MINENQPGLRTHGTHYDRAISIHIRALRVVIVRISHILHARHAGVYESPFSTHARSLQDLDTVGIQEISGMAA
jgi:hypothetical protein